MTKRHEISTQKGQREILFTRSLNDTPQLVRRFAKRNTIYSILTTLKALNKFT